MYNNEENIQAINWSEELTAEAEKGFVLLEPGVYKFVILGVEKTRHEKRDGGKIPSCPKVVLTLAVKDEKNNEVKLTYNLFYYQKMKWQIDNLFIGTGKAKEGEPYVPNPDFLLGAYGYCEVSQTPGYKDSTKMYNRVEKIVREYKDKDFGGF